MTFNLTIILVRIMYSISNKNILKVLLIIITFFAASLTASSQEYQVRIACMGNSITYGAGVSDPSTESYPAQLGVMLQEKYGDTCVVKNFGNSGRTMLKHGDYPLWNEKEFTNAMAFAPNICLILLGTNDTKPYNWDVYGDEFYGDYMSMIDTFRVRNPFVKFIVCYPPPAFAVVWDIRDSVIVNGVIPVIDQVLANTDATLIDFYHPLLDSVYLFPDKIHPGVQGSKDMAQMICDKIIETDLVHNVETGLPFITKLTSDRQLITVNDTTTVEWETINADTVYFDGEIVDSMGSVKVSPDENTVYTMIAKNDKYSDTVHYKVSIYTPEVTRMSLGKSLSRIETGDTCLLTANYFDQYKYPISGIIVDLNWSLNEGEGQLFDAGDNTIGFKSDTAGVNKISATYGDIVANINLRVYEKETGIKNQKSLSNIDLFPNPASHYINLSLPSGFKGTWLMYNLNGQLVKKEQTITPTIDIRSLEHGVYFIKIIGNNEYKVLKFVKE